MHEQPLPTIENNVIGSETDAESQEHNTAVDSRGELHFSPEEFFTEFGKVIEDYAEDRGLVFRKGKGWAMNMKTGEATYDPTFFTERGYTPGQAMWATCHEIEHFRDHRRDPVAYRRVFARRCRHRRYDRFYNILDDIQDNRTVETRFPSLTSDREQLYREMLFPGTDWEEKGYPKHLQFLDSLLRERMVPAETLSLAPDVRAEVERLHNIDDEGTDFVELISDPELEPAVRFQLLQEYIEPIYEKFFQEDAEEHREKREAAKEGGDSKDGGDQTGEGDQGTDPKKGGKTRASGGERRKGKREDPEDYFKDYYNDYDNKNPEPISGKQWKEIFEGHARGAGKPETPEERARKQFEREHGVSLQDVEAYRRDYQKIERYIEPLRETFKRIIAERKEYRRRLKELTDSGVIVKPDLLPQTYLDMKSGIENPYTQLRVRKEEHDEHKPNDLEITLLCDLSVSMKDEDVPGKKRYEQRMSLVLLMEALHEFEEELAEERKEKNLNLHVYTEARGFGSGDEELKILSDTLKYVERVAVRKRLLNPDGGSTDDFASLGVVDRSIDVEKRESIQKGNLKKIVLLLTDGGSSDTRLAKKELESLLEAGVITRAIQIGETSTEDQQKFRYVWGENGSRLPYVEALPQTIEMLLEDFLSDV